MSLKAKIEAVIYAAEEPVTLVQLAGLLGHEAQAELDRIDSAQHTLSLDEPEDTPADPDALNSEVLSESSESEEEPSDEARHQALDQALHRAAAVEAHEAAIHAQHIAADNAAMSSEETLPAFVAPVVEEVTENAAAPETATADEKKAAREEKARALRLRDYFRTLLDQLISDYANGDRGLEIREVAGGYRLATKPEYHDAVRGFVKSLKPPLKLSLQALETLAVVAYKQPVTAPEISEIRGVDSGGVLGSLMARKLITTAGRKQVIGRPILYKTTRDFLLRFGLKDINELPSIEEFEKMAGELADVEPVQEEIAMPEHAATSNETEGESTETVADEAIVDGRISGLPPNYDTDQLPSEVADSPALDAEIQADVERESEEPLKP
jgi:segregation and condensation protein B